MLNQAHTRTITLAGCGNFRDLGGYETKDGRRTRWRRVFRSDSLHQLTPADIDTLHEQGIHLTLGFDLRTITELENVGRGSLYESGVLHKHVPFVAAVGDAASERYLAASLGELYLEMFEAAHECVAAFFATLADEANYPLVHYCAAGKDRTGMLTAVLLRSLGVPDEQIIADYVLTEQLTLKRLQARVRESGRKLNPDFLLARPETMQAFLAALDARHDSIEDYLAFCGVSEKMFARARTLLIE